MTASDDDELKMNRLVRQHPHGTWWIWNEAGERELGPYDDREAARQAYERRESASTALSPKSGYPITAG